MSCDLLRLLTAVFLCVCSVTATTELDWWESATLYQIYPRSFMDSDGDGIGDLNGITSRLEFLKEIGVTATWLSPIYESPMADMGYDVANFTNVDPIFGTLDDFDAMIAKAHQLGIKIIMDFVPNHSSDECEWFQKSIRREDGFDDFYVWADGKIDPETGERQKPCNWDAGGISVWEWNEERQQYYLHRFQVKQPDLNLTNPIVRQYLAEALEFWLNRGVDSFRIDAVHCFIETRYENGTFPDEIIKGEHTNDLPQNRELLYEWRALLDEYTEAHGGDTRIQLAESFGSMSSLSDYISNGTHVGSQMPMNFNLIQVRASTTAYQLETYIKSWMDVMWTNHKQANWHVGNHDQSRPATRIGVQKKDMMTMIVHALPGTSVTYNGDEIGMTDSDNSRDAQRSPMQWDTSENAGFSTGNSTWLPVNSNYKYLNVQTQRGVARSTLNILKGMIKLKKTAAFKAFREDGGFSYGALKEQVFQIVRTAAGIEEYRLLANFGNQIEYLDGLTNKTVEYVLLNSYSPHNYGDKVDLSKRIYLMPYEAVILRWSA